MRSSLELRNLILQLYDKESSGGLFAFAGQLYSHQDGVLVIGSAPGDRYEGYEAIMNFYAAASGAVPEVKVEDLRAYQAGASGWVVDLVTARLPNGIEIPVRHTYVFQEEDNQWKIVHAHISVGISDEVLGVKGTKPLE